MNEPNLDMPQNEADLLGAMPFMSPHQQYSSSILHMTDPNKLLVKLEYSLKGVRETDAGEIEQIGSPLMNQKGINSVMSQIRALVNQNTIMSNFENREIPILTDFLADTLAKDLMINRVTYSIKSKEARDTIYFIAISTAYACLKRGFNQGERGFWRGTQQEIINRVDSSQQNAFAKILGWGKK